jgi:hypothetical protein
MYYAVQDPDGNAVYPTATAGYESCWRVEKRTYNQLVETNCILWKKTERNGNLVWWPYVKYYLEGRSKRPSPLWTDIDGNKKATREVRALFDGVKVFDYIKPLDFIKKIIQIAPNVTPIDIIVDFFSGSATTAHAVMQLKSQYKYIMVQLPAALDRTITSQQVAADFLSSVNRPQTLDQIGIERIIRAAKAIREANPATTGELDLGFKHYILAEPSQNTLDKLEKFDLNDNAFVASGLLTEFGKPTVLATWLSHDGYGLTANPEEIDFAGYKGYYIGKHLYLIDEKLSNEAIEAILMKFESDGSFNPENIVLFGYSFLWTEREALQTNLKRLKDTEKNLRMNFDIRY